MRKEILIIPKGIRYLGLWNEFKLSLFPPKSIVDKKIPGCGFTRYCLTGPENVILCSPRKMLLENKKEQHPEIYLVRNELEVPVKFDSGSITEFHKPDESNLYSRLFSEISSYCNDRILLGKPIKVAVTYDSYRIVLDILGKLGLLGRFITVVDEFQSILDDARFKASTEIEFLSVLSKVDKVIYVSATPMLEEFLSCIPEFKDLPFIEMDWNTQDPGRLIKPNLSVKKMRSISSRAKEIIDSYLSGDYESVIVSTDTGFKKIESKEAVFYVNSVKHISSIIKANGLLPEQVNILCSNTPENQKSINTKLKSKKYVIGKPVGKGEPHKMFTFCTRTVYLGADFYSTCARSFIFSDSNLDFLSMDISMDLPQILGRQRLEENPWNNTATFYYKSTADYNKMSKEDFDRIIEYKYKKSLEGIGTFKDSSGNYIRQETLIDLYEASIKADKYSKNYVSVNGHSGGMKIPVLNELVYLNEIRTFKIQQIDFKDRFSVMAKVCEVGEVVENMPEIVEFLNTYESSGNYREKMKLLCEFAVATPKLLDTVLQNLGTTDLVYQHFSLLGSAKCKALGYDSSLIKREVDVLMFDESKLARELFTKFSVGNKMSKKEIKEALTSIYGSLGYCRVPKASDLEKYFELKSVKVKDDAGKWVNGFEIVGKR